MAYNSGASSSGGRPRPRLQSRGSSEQVEVVIDPMHDTDAQMNLLHEKVLQLKNVAQEIDNEARTQNEFLRQFEDTITKAQAGLKGTMSRLNRTLKQSGSNHMLHVVLFSLACFFAVYLWIKFR